MNSKCILNLVYVDSDFCVNVSFVYFNFQFLIHSAVVFVFFFFILNMVFDSDTENDEKEHTINNAIKQAGIAFCYVQIKRKTYKRKR